MKRTAAAIAVLLALLSLPLAAQAPAKGAVQITVTDPLGRTVSGLKQDQFSVTENGMPRNITVFTEVRDQSGASYRVEFESPTPGARVEVTLQPPRGVPALTVTWK